MPSKVLLLDVMDTLVHDPFRASVPLVFGMDVETYFSLKDKGNYLDFEKGRITPEHYAANLFFDKRPVDLDALRQAFREGYRYIDGIPELLADLAEAGVEMHALSNYSVFYEMIEDKLGLSTWVPWTFVSAVTGRRKPDADTFLEAAKALGRPPKDCVFVDDREKNCAGARAVGMHGLRFRDAATLRRDLRDLGLPL